MNNLTTNAASTDATQKDAYTNLMEALKERPEVLLGLAVIYSGSH